MNSRCIRMETERQGSTSEADGRGVPDFVLSFADSARMDCFSQDARRSATGAVPSSSLGQPSTAR